MSFKLTSEERKEIIRSMCLESDIDRWPFLMGKIEDVVNKNLGKAAPVTTMRKVVLESPFAGDVEANIEYAKKCVHDCLKRGEAPIASHLLFTQPGILNDLDPEERKLGIGAGHAWTGVADAVVVYTDRGMSRGMEAGILAAQKAGTPIEYRSLQNNP